MAYDEHLANRVRELLGEQEVIEQQMFGGLAFLIGGHIALAVSGRSGLMMPCAHEQTERLCAKLHARPVERGGRPMRGWVFVDADGVATKRALKAWVEHGVSRSPLAGAEVLGAVLAGLIASIGRRGLRFARRHRTLLGH